MAEFKSQFVGEQYAARIVFSVRYRWVSELPSGRLAAVSRSQCFGCIPVKTERTDRVLL